MAGGGGDDGSRSLEETPTWAVSVVCLILVIISIFIEHIIHLIDKWLTKHNKRALYEALEKIKSELMLLGFISLLLTVGQTPISKICVSKGVGDSWHPCRRVEGDAPKSSSDDLQAQESDNIVSQAGRRLLQHDEAGKLLRRILAGGGGSSDKCAEKGKVPLISTTAINQLHIFIFVLAVVHVIYSITIMGLSRLKMRKWKAWELETKTAEYQFSQDPSRFRFTRETSFARQHLSFWSNSSILIWIVCFFRQFMTSVTKVDYLTLRHGFIMAHLAPHSSNRFDFQKYIKRSLEDDFKVVVGISPTIWFFAVLFLLSNTHGWYSYLWLPFIPLIVILLVGAKLQVIITKMAIRIAHRGDVVKGIPVVQPADDLFWFNRPRLLLELIHFVLFQNAFQLAFFAWTWYEFGYPSCFHQRVEDIVIRSGMGVLIQVLCSYVTLPLYALVTQMGSSMRPTIFNDRVATALRKWHRTARKNLKENQRSGTSVTSLSTSRPSTPTQGLSPVHLLQYYRSDLDSLQTSPRMYINDDHQVEIEESPSPSYHPTSRSSNFHHQNPESPEGPNGERRQMQPFDIDADEISISVHDFSFDKRKK